VFNSVGDGPKRVEMEQMREVYQLENRVTLVGSVKHKMVRQYLIKGRIFLNTSLTEAFGTAMVEAASCGLLIVSTKIGGIPEILPNEMIVFASNVTPVDVFKAVSRAIGYIQSGSHDPVKTHQLVSQMYNWEDVAKRTQKVYETVLLQDRLPLAERLVRYNRCGIIAGKFAVIIITVNYFFWIFLEWLVPRRDIDIAPKFSLALFHREIRRLKKSAEET
jgi:phosphatidylinositol glycan class A protein